MARPKREDGDRSDTTRRSDEAFDRAMKRVGMGEWTKPFKPVKVKSTKTKTKKK